MSEIGHQTTTVKKIANDEILQVTSTNGAGEVFLTTRSSITGNFFLYRKEGNKLEKYRSRNVSDPTEFDEIIWGNR